MASNHKLVKFDVVNIYTVVVMINKPRKSIIAKLVKEGIYVTRGYRTKRGEVPTTKLQLVRAIEDALDIELPDLDKAPKTTIQKLKEAVVEQTSFLEDTLASLRDTSEALKLQKEISSVRALRNSNKSDDFITILGEETSEN